MSSLYRAGFGQGAAIADLNPVTGSARAWDPQIGGDPVFVPVAVAAVGDRLLASGVRGGVTGAYVFDPAPTPPDPPTPGGGGGGSGGAGGSGPPPVGTPGAPSTDPGPTTPAGDASAATAELRSAPRSLASRVPRTTARLLRRCSVRLRFAAPGAGGLHVEWTAAGAAGRGASVARRVVVARGSRGYGAAGTRTVVVRLTRRGRALLGRTRAGRSVRVRSVARFNPAGGGAPVRGAATVRMRRA